MINVKHLAEIAAVQKFIESDGNRTIIFGEYHTQAERNRINAHIRKIHGSVGVDYILSEEIGEQVLTSSTAKQKAIDDQIYSIGPDSILLSMELEVPIVGIDDWTDIMEGRSTKDSFAVREKRMSKVIGDHLSKGVVAVIIGDTHIRRSTTPELGPPSSVWTKYKGNSKVTFVRSPRAEVA